MSSIIDPGASMGSVQLTVHDLEAQMAFYRERLGLDSLSASPGRASLGAGGRELLVLREDREAPRAPGTAGLYHFALLLPSRRDLANALSRLVATGTSLTGVADHGVSEALYLDDVEGNGIELYRDRPREQWPRAEGALRMTSDPLDLGGLLAEADGGAIVPLPNRSRMGHVHLHVPHLEQARLFYCDTLGFDLMQRFGSSAMFVSAGGYHHHLGLNTWQGLGAPPPPPGALGLLQFVVSLTSPPAAQQVRERLERAGVPIEVDGSRFAVSDPAAHRLVFEVTSGARAG
ncbi:MAG: VOC family protein [Candidatus Eiseniibacteriota bacterium]